MLHTYTYATASQPNQNQTLPSQCASNHRANLSLQTEGGGTICLPCLSTLLSNPNSPTFHVSYALSQLALAVSQPCFLSPLLNFHAHLVISPLVLSLSSFPDDQIARQVVDVVAEISRAGGVEIASEFVSRISDCLCSCSLVWSRRQFYSMQQKGVFPNEVSYLSVLSACGHMGLVEEGRKYFHLMVEQHRLSQNVLHYSCLVDILSRAGLIYDAYNVIRTMPFEATASMWGSLLGACKNAGNLELGEIAAKHLFEIEPANAGNHVLLSSIYAANKKWKEVAECRQVLRESEAIKERGKSWIEIKHQVHTFKAGEREHPQTREIYSKLDEVMEEMAKLGYKVEIGHDVHDVDESTKAELLRHHSEKLALAFGLITLPSGVPIRIIKNLRICGDCHSFMKYASKTTNREILVRDVNRFHQFTDGYCSCGDFW